MKLLNSRNLTLGCLIILAISLASNLVLVSSVFADTEQNTRASRVTSYPTNIDTLGSYSIAATTGTIGAGASSDSPIFSFRWTSTTSVALIKSVRIGAGSLATGFTAGTSTCGIIFARSFTASDTGGTALTLTTDNGKRKTSFGTTGVTSLRISSTAALSAGTRTLDAQDLNVIGPFTTTNAVQTNFIPAQTVLFGRDPFEWPLVISANEGFIIRCTVPATGTWNASIAVDWHEVLRYP